MTFFIFTKAKGAFYMSGEGIAKVENVMAVYATERKCDIAIMRWAETTMDRIANICDDSLEEN